ncbi:MAG: hypothetical protein ACYCV4_05505 [Dermatophilaceae bacterium]
MPTKRIIEAAFLTSLGTVALLSFVRLWGQKQLADSSSPGWKTFAAKAVVW